PYIPFSAETLWKQLNLEETVHKQKWNTASELKISSKHKIDKPTVLFQRVQDKDIREEREKLERLSTRA
ncbi:hypothetical protein KAU92_05655, partial [Candidatus Bathyarchaeota archaeon]|nr:hypothetical protein [Candidatus Bathyarchaeota archaeon]